MQRKGIATGTALSISFPPLHCLSLLNKLKITRYILSRPLHGSAHNLRSYSCARNQSSFSRITARNQGRAVRKRTSFIKRDARQRLPISPSRHAATEATTSPKRSNRYAQRRSPTPATCISSSFRIIRQPTPAFLSSNDIAEKEGLTRIACMNDLNIGNVYSIYKDYREASQMYKKALTARNATASPT